MQTLILDGHPDSGRLITYLLDCYEASLGDFATVQRLAVRDLAFDPNLRQGYRADQTWEPDLQRVGAALDACDHLVVGFPLWWGGEPMLLKGLLDRILLPGWLLSGSGVVPGPSRNQAGDERAEQGFAASTRVVHELKETEIERQLLLRDASVRAQPGAQQ